jgi:hypothetical protein
MANKERGELAFTVGDRTYTLAGKLYAFAEMEGLPWARGRTTQQIIRACALGSVRDVALVFWGGLRHHHAPIANEQPDSMRKVCELIESMDEQEVQRVAKEFIGINVDAGDAPVVQRKGFRPRKAQAGTGDGSKPTLSRSA